MSYYFAIVGAQDNPLFEYEFGTSKQGGDGQSRFSDQLRHLNQFILHSSLDIAEEVQWAQGQMSVSQSVSQVSLPKYCHPFPILFSPFPSPTHRPSIVFVRARLRENNAQVQACVDQASADRKEGNKMG